MIGRLIHSVALRLGILAGPDENAYYVWADNRIHELEARRAAARRRGLVEPAAGWR